MKHILYVEDDVDDQSLFEEALDVLGVPVNYDIAADGYTAIEKLNTPPPVDLVLLDLNMPILNGFETLRTIKQTDRLKHIPVYILSTSASQKDIEKCHELGAKGFITKPTDFEVYCQKLSAVLRKEL